MTYKRKIIGVLGRPGIDDEEDKIVSIFEDFRTALLKKNTIPFLIMPPDVIDYVDTEGKDIKKLDETQKSLLREMVDLCDGIMVPGGYRWYEYDEFVVEYAIEKDIPVLGICMGMQLLSKIDNNALNLELNETEMNHRQRKVKYVHDVEIVENTKLMDIVKSKNIKVNSKHRYHITGVNKYKISAYSEDGLIEAIEKTDSKFVIGIQWHPEKMLDYDEYANKILDEFILNCKRD